MKVGTVPGKDASSVINKVYDKLGFLVDKIPLVVGGLIMCIFALPIAMWKAFNTIGTVYSYLDSIERQIWKRANSAEDTLTFFGFLGVALIVVGLILWFIEWKGFLRKSKMRNLLCLIIPVLITLIVVLATYPVIFEFASTIL